MRIPRAYLPAPMQPGQIIELDQRVTHHLLNVLRLKSGNPIVLFNGESGEYSAKLIIDKKIARAEITEYKTNNRESPIAIHLLQGLSRNDRMDLAIQKSVELGVRRITPLITERSAALPVNRYAKKMQHWQGIIISACEQSGRSIIPQINEPVAFHTWLGTLTDNHYSYILNPEAKKPLQNNTKNDTINIIIGPEGGFSEQEIATAINQGCRTRHLGPRILRTETAAIAAITISLHQI